MTVDRKVRASPSPSPGARSIGRRILGFVGQTVAIGAITFLLAEATIRACRYFYPTALPSIIFYDQSYNRYRGRPGAPDYEFKLNSAGFKDTEFTATKAPGTLRILALGDSFAFGVVPYEFNYLTLLERRLNDAGRRTEVINMGIPGLGPQDYLALLANEGLALRPDRVVVSFFVGNDFDETMRLRTRLHEFSDALALIKYVVDSQTKFNGQIVHREPHYDDNAAYFKDATYLEIEKQRSWVFRKPPTYAHALDDAVGYLRRINELCAEHQIRVTVVVIPDELQVNRELQGEVMRALSVDAEALDFSQPNRFLAEQLPALGMDLLDLLDTFSGRSTQGRLYRPNDSHWNIAGNALAADLLAAHLTTRLSVGTPATDAGSKD